MNINIGKPAGRAAGTAADVKFCPKCGVEAAEGQKYCKSCGTDLQVVSEALSGGADSLAQFKVELEGMKRALVEGGKSLGETIKREALRHKRYGNSLPRAWARNPAFWGLKIDIKGQQSPGQNKGANSPSTQSADWEYYLYCQKELEYARMDYSRQHNLMHGLISLFGGGAASAVFYYIGHSLVQAGTAQNLEQLSKVHGLAQAFTLVWLLGLIPAAKGLAQLIYGVFAPSISKLQRGYPAPSLASMPGRNPAPETEKPGWSGTEAGRPDVFATDPQLGSPPPSITERTTSIIDRAEPGVARESQ